jgi:hypothetical protein
MAACSKKKKHMPPYVQTIKIKGKTPDLCVEKQHIQKGANRCKSASLLVTIFSGGRFGKVEHLCSPRCDRLSKKTHSPKFISSGFEKESTDASRSARVEQADTLVCNKSLLTTRLYQKKITKKEEKQQQITPMYTDTLSTTFWNGPF